MLTCLEFTNVLNNEIQKFFRLLCLQSDYVASNEMMIGKTWFRKDVEGIRRNRIWDNIPAFTWRDWEKPQITLVRIAGSWPGFWSQDLPNTKQRFSVLLLREAYFAHLELSWY
jgi:hypothetical protein